MVLQDLDISARFLPVIRAFLWDFIGCSALANSKREDMSYSQARVRARARSLWRTHACFSGRHGGGSKSWSTRSFLQRSF